MRLSSLACLSCLWILILNAESGSCLQADKRGADIALVDAEHKGLLFAVFPRLPYRQKVLALCTQQEDG